MAERAVPRRTRPTEARWWCRPAPRVPADSETSWTCSCRSSRRITGVKRSADRRTRTVTAGQNRSDIRHISLKVAARVPWDQLVVHGGGARRGGQDHRDATLTCRDQEIHVHRISCWHGKHSHCSILPAAPFGSDVSSWAGRRPRSQSSRVLRRRTSLASRMRDWTPVDAEASPRGTRRRRSASPEHRQRATGRRDPEPTKKRMSPTSVARIRPSPK